MGRLSNSLTCLISALAWLAIAVASQVDNSTVHLFLVMVPESEIENLQIRAARQEEGVEGALGGLVDAAGPAAAVSQILKGVLGGDVRPIFAGTVGFIPEGDFRDGVTQVLEQTIAPVIQMIIMEFSKNVQMAFNATSPRPNQQNITNPSQFQQQFQQGQGQFQGNYNQFQQQGFPLNNQFQPGNFQQNQYQPGQFQQNQYQPGQFQQNQFQPGNNNFYPNNQQNQFFPQNGLPNQQNQIQSPAFQQPNYPNQVNSQNLQPNFNQFQQNIQPQQPNFNQFQSNANQPNYNNQFQQAGQFQPNFNQFQQNQNARPVQNNLNQAQNLNQPIKPAKYKINPKIEPKKVVSNPPSSKRFN